MARPRIPLRQRLEKFLGAPLEELDPDACWPWGGTIYNFKPIVLVDGKREQARREIYKELFGMLEPTEKLKPLCAHPTCVNPAHAGIIGLPPMFQPAVPAEFLEPPPDEPMDAESLADLILLMNTRDAQEIADQADVPIEVVRAALALPR